MSRFMSDEAIAKQYANFKVTHFSLEGLTYSDGWRGTLEIDFPSADHEDFDESVVDNFFVYDHKGEKIAFDHWYPAEVEKELLQLIRNEIWKRL